MKTSPPQIKKLKFAALITADLIPLSSPPAIFDAGKEIMRREPYPDFSGMLQGLIREKRQQLTVAQEKAISP